MFPQGVPLEQPQNTAKNQPPQGEATDRQKKKLNWRAFGRKALNIDNKPIRASRL